MEDKDIYDLATSVLTAITRDLADGLYVELGGTLNFSWSTDPRVSAWAESAGDPQSPPEHHVVFCYELARQLYRDCTDYYEFAASMLPEEPFQTIFQAYNPKPQLPNYINKTDSIRNMYLGALTWVYFHEIGHLAQEHGYIRAQFGNKQRETRIEDCESNGKAILKGRATVISHVTEFAADVEAVQWCMEELVRHFLPLDGDIDEHSLKEFKSNLYLFICGLSCSLYRFHGKRPESLEKYPVGSHPAPIRRLDLCLPNIYEKLDLNGQGHKLHGLTRSQLVYLCLGAAESVGFFWLWRYAEHPGIPEHFLAGGGIFFDPHKMSYWPPIVKAWDELEPVIKSIRRYGNELGILYFTDQVRSAISQES